MAEIRVEQLHKAFADFTAVQESTFTVKDGDFFCLLGPSGCGKTTTLRMIAGLELPTSGRIFLGGEDVTFKRASARDIAFVFQLFALYPHMNVRRNIAFPLVSQGMAKAEIERRVADAARTLRITELLDQPVSGLSAGDRQRVALGRAIVRQPLAFMMDEPLGALDSEFRELMCGELRALHDRLHATTVYVTHDQLEAMAMADTIAVMNQGVIEQLGAPQEVYERPASVFVADFIGSPAMNFLPFDAALPAGTRSVRVAGIAVDVPTLQEDISERALWCGVRPEHVRLDDGSRLRAEVLGTEYLGTSRIVTLSTAAGTTLRAKVAVQTPVRRGDHVGLAFDARAISLFDRASGRALRTEREAVRLGARHG
ncbi:MAG: ABC transporter ATP-binding protein [Proteobacteria bacterium]|nr:ABC transporter ATP-binding protein [Pseudomonadota bacterium]